MLVAAAALAGCAGGTIEGGSGEDAAAALAGATTRTLTLRTATAGKYVTAEGGGGGGTPGWKLAWSDECDGPAGAGIDGNKWTFDSGGGGWGNAELEYYTNRTDNVRLDGAGNLQIVARAENYGGRGFTSGRINT